MNNPPGFDPRQPWTAGETYNPPPPSRNPFESPAAMGPAEPWRPSPAAGAADPAISIFATFNFVFAVLAFVGLIGVGAILVYGVFFSGDQGSELAAGVAGCVVLGALPAAMFAVCLAAGIGLISRRRWGYYLHLTGAVLAAFTCVGIIYTILAFISASRPEFSAAFFAPPEGPNPAWPAYKPN
jgi:hypothetical protein